MNVGAGLSSVFQPSIDRHPVYLQPKSAVSGTARRSRTTRKVCRPKRKPSCTSRKAAKPKKTVGKKKKSGKTTNRKGAAKSKKNASRNLRIAKVLF